MIGLWEKDNEREEKVIHFCLGLKKKTGTFNGEDLQAIAFGEVLSELKVH